MEGGCEERLTIQGSWQAGYLECDVSFLSGVCVDSVLQFFSLYLHPVSSEEVLCEEIILDCIACRRVW